MRRLLTLLLPLLLSGSLPAASPKAADEILSALQTRLESGAGFEDLVEQLGELSPNELTKIQEDFDKGWEPLRTRYLSSFQEAAKTQHSGPARQESKKRIRELREQFMQVRGMPEGPMKEALKKVSDPAVKELRELLLPSAARILEGSDENLQKQRKLVLRLGEFRDGILRAAVAIEEPKSVEKLLAAETGTAEEFSDVDREALRVMENNRKIAEKAEVPEKERIGVEDANLMRVLVGLHALVLDPKLCDASRGHSEDMEKLGFFAHESPVKGKRSPSARARLAGTSGGGENIYVGSGDPKAANRGWFFSPGHHKNMFNGGYKRIGLGGYGRHWTQMFGR